MLEKNSTEIDNLRENFLQNVYPDERFHHMGTIGYMWKIINSMKKLNIINQQNLDELKTSSRSAIFKILCKHLNIQEDQKPDLIR